MSNDIESSLIGGYEYDFNTKCNLGMNLTPQVIEKKNPKQNKNVICILAQRLKF